ncbi:MAG TPA: ABC transporter permease subunit [Gammaproteobacteria bacterium]|nr:ABC transporter permease subunit [Gammaproteobacteria bacterium]
MLKTSPYIKAFTLAGYIFLYAPIVILIIYSFNESRLVTVWSGFSLKWYGELFQDTALLTAAKTSLTIALATATGATVLGILAAYALTGYRLKGGAFFNVLIRAPMVLPEVIMGFSLLLLFVALENSLGFPNGRGMLTIWIAHMTLSVAYATVVIAVRLQEMDRSLVLAARDLGARAHTIFFRITLPLIMPALLSAWLLSFTLSFDDLVITSFTSGPDSTTLPMVVYSSVRLGVSPKINALATLMISIVTLMAIAFCLILMRLEQKKAP